MWTTSMLVDLHPEWMEWPGDVSTRWGMGCSFDCLCGCKGRVDVWFDNPMDGFLQSDEARRRHPLYRRWGAGWGDLNLIPIEDPTGSGAHFKGFVIFGETYFGRVQ